MASCSGRGLMPNGHARRRLFEVAVAWACRCCRFLLREATTPVALADRCPRVGSRVLPVKARSGCGSKAGRGQDVGRSRHRGVLFTDRRRGAPRDRGRTVHPQRGGGRFSHTHAALGPATVPGRSRSGRGSAVSPAPTLGRGASEKAGADSPGRHEAATGFIDHPSFQSRVATTGRSYTPPFDPFGPKPMGSRWRRRRRARPGVRDSAAGETSTRSRLRRLGRTGCPRRGGVSA
jgi:hypothetical protein